MIDGFIQYINNIIIVFQIVFLLCAIILNVYAKKQLPNSKGKGFATIWGLSILIISVMFNAIFSNSESTTKGSIIVLPLFLFLFTLVDIPLIFSIVDEIFTGSGNDERRYYAIKGLIYRVIGLGIILAAFGMGVYAKQNGNKLKGSVNGSQVTGLAMIIGMTGLIILFSNIGKHKKKISTDMLFTTEYMDGNWQTANHFPVYDRVYQYEFQYVARIVALCILILLIVYRFFWLIAKQVENINAQGSMVFFYILPIIVVLIIFYASFARFNALKSNKFMWKYAAIIKKEIYTDVVKSGNSTTITTYYYIYLDNGEKVTVNPGDFSRYFEYDKVFIVRFGEPDELQNSIRQEGMSGKMDALY